MLKNIFLKFQLACSENINPAHANNVYARGSDGQSHVYFIYDSYETTTATLDHLLQSDRIIGDSLLNFVHRKIVPRIANVLDVLGTRGGLRQLGEVLVHPRPDEEVQNHQIWRFRRPHQIDDAALLAIFSCRQ